MFLKDILIFPTARELKAWKKANSQFMAPLALLEIPISIYTVGRMF